MSANPETVWRSHELAVLRDVFPKAGAQRVATILGRTFSAVTTQAQRLGIKGHGRGKRPDCSAMTDRIVMAVQSVGPSGLDIHEVREAVNTMHPHTVVTTISRLVASGVVFSSGWRQNRRYFATKRMSDTWDQFMRPRTLAEKRALKHSHAALPAGVQFHPQFKFTRAPTHPAPLRSNTHSLY